MGSPIIFSGNNAKLLKSNLDYGTNVLEKTGNFSTANNQSAATNVTGLTFTNSTDRGGLITLSVFIDATSDLFASFTLEAIQKGSTWELSSMYTGDVTGIIFSITTAGQIQYTSTNVSGFSSGLIRYKQSITKI